MNRCLPIIVSTIVVFLVASSIAQAGDYVNQEFGFSFGYPESYSLKKSSDIYFSIRNKEGHIMISGVVEYLNAYPRSLYENLKDPFRDFGIHRALFRCAADGPDGSAYCPSINSSREFYTQNGIRTIELSLNHVQETFGERPEKSESVVGPVYLFDISNGNETAVLIIGSAPWEQMDQEHKSIAETILATLKRFPE